MVADSHRSPPAGPVLRRPGPGSTEDRPRLWGVRRHRVGQARGEVAPTKFWGIRGIGMEPAGKHLRRHERDGLVLRKFTPDGKLVWELCGHFFVDVACADPATDGDDVWGIQEHLQNGLLGAPGQEAKWVGYSLDRHQISQRPARADVREATGGARADLAASRLPRREAVPLRRRHVRQQLHQHLPLRRRDRRPVGTDHAVGRLALPHRLEMAASPARGGVHLARHRRGWRLPGRESAPNTDRVRPGPFWVDKRGNIWMAYGPSVTTSRGSTKGNPVYRADRTTSWDPPKG